MRSLFLRRAVWIMKATPAMLIVLPLMLMQDLFDLAEYHTGRLVEFFIRVLPRPGVPFPRRAKPMPPAPQTQGGPDHG